MRDKAYLCHRKGIVFGHISANAGQSVKNRDGREPFQLNLSYRDCGSIFCDHSGASECSAVTVAPISRRIHTSRPKRGLDYDSIPMGRTLNAQPQQCVLEFRNRLSDLCEHNRCAGISPTLTPMPVLVFKHDTCGSYQYTPKSYTR